MFASKLPIYLHLKTVQFFEKTCENKSFCFFTKKPRFLCYNNLYGERIRDIKIMYTQYSWHSNCISVLGMRKIAIPNRQN